MGVPTDDAVVIQRPKTPGEPAVVTVNCPDKTGLGCDIVRIIFDFGLYVVKGDLSTDGVWCYIVLFLIPCGKTSRVVRWSSLRDRLLSACPSCSMLNQYYQPSTPSVSSSVYLVKFFCLDRKGLLHDVTQVLSELELTIQRVKVTTTPDGRVLDLLFITDNMGLLHTKRRQVETYEQLRAVLGESCINCEIMPAGPEYDNHHSITITSLSQEIAEELFSRKLSESKTHNHAPSPELSKLKKASITMDNTLSPSHTLLQIHCVDQKGILYDLLRPLKDCSIQIAYGRVLQSTGGFRDIDLFIQQKDGKKIADPEKQTALSSRLNVEMLHPLRVAIVNSGPDAVLFVANPVELSGRGRPRVFYDVTSVLKLLSICIFSADTDRHWSSDREWEVYRFLLDENCEYELTNVVSRNQIVEKVRRALMGW
ncbi:unnamed protein product [Rhodiola kirilowii]